MRLPARLDTVLLSAVFLCAPIIAAAPAVDACSCAYSPAGFLAGKEVLLPANAAGVAWSGRGGSHPDGMPVADDFRIAVREGTGWRTLRAELVQPGDLAAARKGRGDEPLVLVRPHGGFRAGARYRIFCSIARVSVSAVDVVVSETEFHVGDRKAGATFTPRRSGLDVASSRGGMCGTMFDGVSTTLRIALPDDLEPFREALLFALHDADGRVWRPDSNLCDPTPVGRNSIGSGHERLFVYCGPPDIEAAKPRSDGSRILISGPDESITPGKDIEFEFLAWLPGTKERISARGTVTLQCGGRRK